MMLDNLSADQNTADRTLAPGAGPVEYAILYLPDCAQDWDLVVEYLRLRKEVFIDRKTWPLYEHGGIEFEQYDAMDTVYVVAHRNRHVVGGARLRRTDKRTGNGALTYTYMIRDACLGRLPGMPTDLCYQDPPVGDDVWEITRMAVESEAGVARGLLDTAYEFLQTKGARQCLLLGSPAFLRMARMSGWKAEPMGPVSGNHDGRFIAISCDLTWRPAPAC
ncbi:MAG: acyl-homoserine-lactone synthase [Pseudomonadota bacterium]